jgi:uncharacterized protein (DUF1778 family)
MPRTLKHKEERIELRIKQEDKRLLQKAADAQGLSVSSYVVFRSLSAAREDAAPYRTYTVAQRDSETFARLLENPPPPNEKLKTAVQRYRSRIS